MILCHLTDIILIVVSDCFRVTVPHYGPAGEVFPICLAKRCLQQCVPSQPYCTLSNGIATYVMVNSGSGDLGHFLWVTWVYSPSKISRSPCNSFLMTALLEGIDLIKFLTI